MTTAEVPILFPAPRSVIPGEGQAVLRPGARLFFGFSEGPLLRHAVADLNACVRKLASFEATAVFGTTHGATANDVLLVQAPGTGPEGYRLTLAPQGVRVEAEAPAGAFYAIQTLIQCLRPVTEGVAAPALHIEDGPDFAHRGLFVENKWGMDRMTLDDWKALIDHLSRLKLNLLGVGAYGCWCIQYEGQVTEFLTLPIPEYPLLRTEKTIRYYSPKHGWQHLTYLPTIFQEDFFGEIVAYGRERNVIVRPQFNSLGHNTLIPRLYPEVSARDAHGEPTGYGYCLSNPKTYEMVFRMYDSIIARYLRPHGVDYFHIGMDEVWPQIAADPRDPHRVVQPWCECPQCAQRSREELLVEYTARLCAHLKEQGITHISAWNDQFVRHMDVVEPLVNALKEKDVAENVILQWWHYGLNFPQSLRPELGLARWVTPMTGYYFWSSYQSYLRNIYGMLQLGARDGATGAESYCSYDRAFDREITCLAEYAWRNNAGDLDAFRRKYVRFLFGDHWEEGEKAFTALEAVCEPNDLRSFLGTLFHYPYTYVNRNLPYPRHYPGERLRSLMTEPNAANEKLAEAIRCARTAREGFLALRCHARQPEVAAELAAEAHRIETTAEEFRVLLGAVQAYQRAVGSEEAKVRAEAIRQAQESVRRLIAAHLALMQEIEQVKAKPLLPQTLRELTAMWRALHLMADRLAEAARAAEEGRPLPGLESVFLQQVAT